LLFLKLSAAKNVPGGEALVPVPDKPIRGKSSSPAADPAALDRRMVLGMKWGVAVAAIPAIVIAFFIKDLNQKPDPLVVEILKKVLIAFFLTTMGGGGCGAALAALTIPGVHRRNILLGTTIGLMLGYGIGYAMLPGAVIPAWQAYCFSCGLFAFLGMLCGLFSGDNFKGVAPAPITAERLRPVVPADAHSMIFFRSGRSI
jgi:hypothetical protein